MKLGIGALKYADLYDPNQLKILYSIFEEHLQRQDPNLYEEFDHYRETKGTNMSPEQISSVLIKVAPWLSEFIVQLFKIEKSRSQQMSDIQAESLDIAVFRKSIVIESQKLFKSADISSFNIDALCARINILQKIITPSKFQSDPERRIAHTARLLLSFKYHHPSDSKKYLPYNELRTKLSTDLKNKALFEKVIEKEDDQQFIDALLQYFYQWAYIAQQDTKINKAVRSWTSFKFPKKTDFNELVPHLLNEKDAYQSWQALPGQSRQRDGFALTDERYNERQTQYEVDHCIYCHERDTDSCSKGMRSKRTTNFKKNPLDITLIGCPLEQKISEMHILKRDGDNIAALALVMIDNPMCPGTGHRICNDCMKACIYQKKEPVNIPQIETHVLTGVLELPYGFEIYGLLTRWNPLNIQRPYMQPYNGKNTLVVGMGPAGYTLSHYLLNEGFAVVGIDALKIEPLPLALTGSEQSPPQAIKEFQTLYQKLDERMLVGFGGVAEYGITARWDKNFLMVIYLTLARRNTFRCFGGVRFGGALTIENAWSFGFDHIALASGAGKPTIIGMQNNLIRGIRKASDFLMALQLTGAAKNSSLANLQLRLPAGVIGGGLTAIDTATEALAYYPVQVEKILHRYEKLTAHFGVEHIRTEYDTEELSILDEFLEHGKIIRAERERAKLAGQKPDFVPLIEAWGGVSLFYRKGIKDSPAYRQNHEEVQEALQEGIQLAEGMNPISAIEDQYGALTAVQFSKMIEKQNQWVESDKKEIPLKSLFIAAGTSPNVIYEQEHPYSFRMDEKFFQRYEPNREGSHNVPELIPMDDVPLPKIGKTAPFTSYQKNNKHISFYGDNHPVYAGSVVRAMASAKDGYPYIVKLFSEEIKALDPKEQAIRNNNAKKFFNKLTTVFNTTVYAVNRLTPTIVEVIVKAPLQAQTFEPGQFYRVQNMESYAPIADDTILAAEGLALTGAWVDKEKGLISLISLEMGSSSKLCALWSPGDPVVVMGVTGSPTEISKNKTVMLIGGGLGNAVLFSIGKALRAAGNKVIYFAGYKKADDVFKVSEIEAASDMIVWAVDSGTNTQPIPTTRKQDKTHVGNIIEAIKAYATGMLGEGPIKLDSVEHMIVIGSDKMMAAIKEARHTTLKPYLKNKHTAIGSINSPMQCMMKGVCAQCLCKHIDPDTGEEYFIYSCYNQDQELDRVDFDNLSARLRQNTVQEKLSNKWLDYLLATQKIKG